MIQSLDAAVTCQANREHKYWLTPESLAQSAPERNDIERVWKTLKAHHLANKTVKNRDSLKVTIDTDIQVINSSRKSAVGQSANLCSPKRGRCPRWRRWAT